MPLSKGLSFYRLDQAGSICYVRQSPEHFVKCAGLAMGCSGMARDLVSTLGPVAMPNFWAKCVHAVWGGQGTRLCHSGITLLPSPCTESVMHCPPPRITSLMAATVPPYLSGPYHPPPHSPLPDLLA